MPAKKEYRCLLVYQAMIGFFGKHVFAADKSSSTIGVQRQI